MVGFIPLTTNLSSSWMVIVCRLVTVSVLNLGPDRLKSLVRVVLSWQWYWNFEYSLYCAKSSTDRYSGNTPLVVPRRNTSRSTSPPIKDGVLTRSKREEVGHVPWRSLLIRVIQLVWRCPKLNSCLNSYFYKVLLISFRESGTVIWEKFL